MINIKSILSPKFIIPHVLTNTSGDYSLIIAFFCQKINTTAGLWHEVFLDALKFVINGQNYALGNNFHTFYHS